MDDGVKKCYLPGGVRDPSRSGHARVRVALRAVDGPRVRRLGRAGGRHAVTLARRQPHADVLCPLSAAQPPQQQVSPRLRGHGCYRVARETNDAS